MNDASPPSSTVEKWSQQFQGMTNVNLHQICYLEPEPAQYWS